MTFSYFPGCLFDGSVYIIVLIVISISQIHGSLSMELSGDIHTLAFLPRLLSSLPLRRLPYQSVHAPPQDPTMAKSKKRRLHTVSNHIPNPYSRTQLLKSSSEKRKKSGQQGQDSKGAHGQVGNGKYKGKAQGSGKGMRRRELPFDVRGNVLCVGEGMCVVNLFSFRMRCR
jgi:hypothetical protein